MQVLGCAPIARRILVVQKLRHDRRFADPLRAHHDESILLLLLVAVFRPIGGHVVRFGRTIGRTRAGPVTMLRIGKAGPSPVAVASCIGAADVVVVIVLVIAVARYCQSSE